MESYPEGPKHPQILTMVRFDNTGLMAKIFDRAYIVIRDRCLTCVIFEDVNVCQQTFTSSPFLTLKSD